MRVIRTLTRTEFNYRLAGGWMDCFVWSRYDESLVERVESKICQLNGWLKDNIITYLSRRSEESL